MCNRVFFAHKNQCCSVFLQECCRFWTDLVNLRIRRKDGNMKKLAAFMLALLIAGASTGAVFAYLTSQDSVNNNITAANTDIHITEKFDPPEELIPGTVIPKTVAVTSSSTTDCYVRVMVHFSSMEAEKFCESLQIQQGWTKGSDGYYYWNNKVKPQETTGTLFSQIMIRKDAAEEDLESFDVLVYAEAVACGEDSMEDAWEKVNI